MKAYALYGGGDLRYEERDCPSVPPGWASVEVMAAGICSSDIPRIFEKGTYHFPTVPGHEFSGVVRAVGDGVEQDWVGKRVGAFPLDLHLMIRSPEYKLQWIGIQEHDIVSIHYESTYQVQRALDWLEPFHCKRFLAINPATPIYVLEEVLDYVDGINMLMVNPGFAGQKIVPSTMHKAEKLASFLEERGKKDIEMEVDGNITPEHAKTLRGIGADIFVAGSSSVFRGDVGEYEGNLRELKMEIDNRKGREAYRTMSAMSETGWKDKTPESGWRGARTLAKRIPLRRMGVA